MKEVARVWIDIEWIVFQPKETFVHGVYFFPSLARSASVPISILSLLPCPENLDSRCTRKSYFALSQHQRPCGPLKCEENLVHRAALPATWIAA
jgi:hypothetical protein